MADASSSAIITSDFAKATATAAAAAKIDDKIDELNRQNAERVAKEEDTRANFARYKLGLTGKTFE